MANILLTTRCVRSCPYCFAKKEVSESPSKDLMSWENLVYLADFVWASGQRNLSLLGGEPTLHPDFVDFVLYLIERNFHVTVFSCGVMSDAKLEELETHLNSKSAERLTIVCNINDPEQTPAPPKETESVLRFLSVMGPRTIAGFNIYRLDFRLEFLIDLINRYGMKRELRLGISHPIPGVDNAYIAPEKISRVIGRLFSYRHLLTRFRIRPGLDCGFPLCKLSDEQLGWLRRLAGKVRFGCGPAIDIKPDMNVYSCFPLSGFYRRSIFEFNSMKEVVDHFKDLHQTVRNEMAGLYEECDGCVHRVEGSCAGGGVCQVLNRLTGEAPVRVPEIENELAKASLSK